MKYLLLFLLLVFPFGQLARGSLFDGQVVVHLNDLAVLAVLVAGLRRVSGPVARALAFFMSAVAVSLVVNFGNLRFYELAVASLYPLRILAYAGLFFVVKDLSIANKRFFLRWLVIAVLVVAIFGLLQYIFVPDVSVLSVFGWDEHYFRLVGAFLDPGFTGAILAFGLVLVFLKFKNLVALSFFYLAMVLTYSRASYLMYLVSFAAIALGKKSLKIFLVAAGVLILTIPLLPKSVGEGTKLERENSVIARMENWQESIRIWQRAPIFGVGFNAYRYVRGVSQESHAGAGGDSSLLFVLATTGIAGLLAYINLLAVMWRTGRSSFLFKASMLAVLAHSFFNNTLFYPWVMEWLWLVLALTLTRG